MTTKTLHPPQMPHIDVLTQEEIHLAVVRASLAKTMSNPDEFIENNDIDTRVAYRNIRTQDGKTSMVAGVALLSTKPKPPRPVEHTPVPTEQKG